MQWVQHLRRVCEMVASEGQGQAGSFDTDAFQRLASWD